MIEPELHRHAIALEDLERVLGSDSGVRVLGAIVFDVAGVFGRTFDIGGDVNAAIYLEGRRSVGIELAALLASRFPDHWIRIQQERSAK